MKLSWVLMQQVLVMFLLIGVGFFCVKRNIISEKGSKQLSDLLIYIVVPCLAIDVYQVDMDTGIIKGIILAFGLAIFSHILAIVVAKLLFRKREDPRYRVERFAAVYSNAGFMGLPLVQATMGDEGVIFATAYLATFNLFAFSLGAMELQGEGHRPKVRSILLHPGIWSVIVGVLLFCFQIHLPNPIGPAIKYVASMNTPLGMMACGAFIAGTKLKGMFRNKGMYGVCAVRLLLIPLLLILIYKPAGVMHWFEGAEMVVIINLITASCPTAAMASIMSKQYNQDAAYGGQLVAVTTILSIVTLPLVVMVAQLI